MRYDITAKSEIESLKKLMSEQKRGTLKMIGEAHRNPEKLNKHIKLITFLIISILCKLSKKEYHLVCLLQWFSLFSKE